MTVAALPHFWRALESVPGLAVVPAEWRSLLGPEYELVRKFLLPTQRLAHSIKTTVPGRACIHEIRRYKGEYLAVCPDGCDTVSLSKEDIIIHKLDVPALCREIAEAIGIEAATLELLSCAAKAMHIGDYVPYSGFRFPVCLTVSGEPEDMRQIVDTLSADGKPFILLSPTRGALSQACTDRINHAKSSFLSLTETIGLDDDGRFALQDGQAANALLADFCAANTPDLKEHDGMVFFPTPAGSRWEDVTISFIDRHSVFIKVGNVSGKYHCAQMGMASNKNAKPTVQWLLLESFAEEHGLLDWRSRKADRKNQKRKEKLAADLQRFFRIEGDPFHIEGNGWQARFVTDIR